MWRSGVGCQVYMSELRVQWYGDGTPLLYRDLTKLVRNVVFWRPRKASPLCPEIYAVHGYRHGLVRLTHLGFRHLVEKLRLD